eukprot:4472578-Amphidinium_carterae.1
MNKPDYFGREYYLVAGLRIRLDDNTGVLLPWFVPIESTGQAPVADAVFQVVNQISQSKQLRQFEGSIVRRISSDGEHVFDNPTFCKRALDLGIGVYKSPPYQPGWNVKDASETTLGIQWFGNVLLELCRCSCR